MNQKMGSLEWALMFALALIFICFLVVAEAVAWPIRTGIRFFIRLFFHRNNSAETPVSA